MHDLNHIQFSGIEPATVSRPRARRTEFQPPIQVLRLHDNKVEPRQSIDPFIAWLLEQAGLNREAYRPIAMHRRLPACLRKLHVRSTAEARALLQQKPELLQNAIDTLLIGVTGLFRDKSVFATLGRDVLPVLLRNSRGIRVYGAGVSGGHEMYSIAMLLAEAGALETSDLLGVDCRKRAIEQARMGLFSTGELDRLSPQCRAKYFTGSGEKMSAGNRLRARMRWRTEDVLKCRESTPWDLILFRNVVIYFDESHALMAWEHLCSQLRPGGILVTGTAEKPPTYLELNRLAPCIYQKAGERC